MFDRFHSYVFTQDTFLLNGVDVLTPFCAAKRLIFFIDDKKRNINIRKIKISKKKKIINK